MALLLTFILKQDSDVADYESSLGKTEVDLETISLKNIGTISNLTEYTSLHVGLSSEFYSNIHEYSCCTMPHNLIIYANVHRLRDVVQMPLYKVSVPDITPILDICLLFPLICMQRCKFHLKKSQTCFLKSMGEILL